MQEVNTIHMDDKFFNEKMGENTDSKGVPSYSVKVVALRVGWMLNHKNGQRFLEAVLNSESMELYQVKTVKLLIEFLYHKYRSVLLNKVLPVFIFQALMFHVLIYINELANERTIEIREQDHIEGEPADREINGFKVYLVIISILNTLSIFIVIN